jgi:hypothetical protein
LHVLGTPPALILSQDQTLKLKHFASGHPLGYPLDNFNTRAITSNGSSLFSFLSIRLILDECASSSYLVFKEPTIEPRHDWLMRLPLQTNCSG